MLQNKAFQKSTQVVWSPASAVMPVNKVYFFFRFVCLILSLAKPIDQLTYQVSSDDLKNVEGFNVACKFEEFKKQAITSSNSFFDTTTAKPTSTLRTLTDRQYFRSHVTEQVRQYIAESETDEEYGGWYLRIVMVMVLWCSKTCLSFFRRQKDLLRDNPRQPGQRQVTEWSQTSICDGKAAAVEGSRPIGN